MPVKTQAPVGSRSVLLKLPSGNASLGLLVKMQIPTQRPWEAGEIPRW